MSEMVERVAKAMFDRLVADDGPWSLAQGESAHYITLDGQFDLSDLAEAAIAAMKFPTLPMIVASGELPATATNHEVWQTMIDAALE